MNTPISDPISLYESEKCQNDDIAYDDMAWIVETAIKLQESMQDSQARYILYVLAKLEKERLLDTEGIA